ncbi:AAA family ATPase, partial [Aeromonas caviae]|uniref:AAA family ATPase n=1 Tax=Aeromonas caviae TaxID=648 RepID=UPI001CC49595
CLLLVGLALAGAALADVVQVQDRRASAGRDVFQRGDMARLVATLEHIAASTGASVLYLHHVSKGSAREGQT